MAVKVFIIDVRYTCDHPDQFKALTEVMQNTAAKLFPLLRIAAGPNSPAPEIKVYSDDSMELIKTEADARRVGKSDETEGS